ncbi:MULTISPECIES: UDP-N-acetylmuramate--L-alanine ligase [Peptoniphilus]|uniref:UDP-N-acetylmuramate--L-alanine ligase n=2 Tax=Peptoniphilaceae TaxID=1570339 RepID=UPI0002891B31|nr:MULTISPECIES: UDP-N-acetylmuramate--L-alanine ligase [Peptoniphilus]MBS6610087.1 UDP-N-acetylmuramate--L-alanine ligase [Peptoniphilus harei]MDU1043425.1 UDP-N-acetylmuramate--L-alanine ligase [Peptoniphilus rhinitidis]MDU1954140.1 UDP-N-acetylmuramate--L-alanine ligase [Peptoniphilus lacydonensis]MDU2115876.1 UDP-N-acetylmuramate--L-alanine ligase [Peptoniphilus lacydonensis]MDU3751253.1 UDP-N-acetylmuramate--L-alanine ligase [Peptoniphilus rhinitidis]
MFEINIDKSTYKNIFFIGIGGISMSALAELMLEKGYNIFGSDRSPSVNTEKLEKNGATIYYEHKKEHIKGMDLVIFTDAISFDNEEYREAVKEKIDLVDRATFLGAIMKNYKKSIAVSGTHGKTTTTSMITEIIKDLEINPTIMLGGQLKDINGNIKIGDSNLFLTEACEYKANISKYFPTTEIILNIDEDHLDFFDNIDHIIRTFKTYVDNLKKDDYVILNIDDENVNTLFPINNCKVVSFGINNDADFMAKNIKFDKFGFPSYDLYLKGEKVNRVELSVLGKHNILNSLAAIAATYVNNISLEDTIIGIKNYKGVERRLEEKGFYNGVKIMDDYAHHPTEIKSSVHAIKRSCKGKLYVVFQPHTFTRTKLLLDAFANSFDESDVIIITDIYAAREKDYGDIHSKTLRDAISSHRENVFYISGFEDILKFLKENTKKDDTIVTMGAGDVYKIGEMILEN